MDKKKGYLCIFVTTILFSSMEIVLKLSAGEFNPVQITMERFLVGGLLLIPFAVSALRKRNRKLAASDFKWFVLLGFVGVLASMTFYQLSILHIEASRVAVLFSSNPLFVAVFAVLLLKEPMYKHKAAAIIGELLGVVFIVQPWQEGLNVTGVAMALTAGLLFALYSVLGKEESRKLGGVTLTCGSFLFGSIEMMALAGLSHVDGVASYLQGHGLSTFANISFIEGFNWTSLGHFLYVAVFVTGVGYALYFVAMEYVSAQEVSMVFFFKPVLASVAAAVILGDEIPLPMMIGIGLILTGSFISMYGDRRLEAAVTITEGNR